MMGAQPESTWVTFPHCAAAAIYAARQTTMAAYQLDNNTGKPLLLKGWLVIAWLGMRGGVVGAGNWNTHVPWHGTIQN
jgi:hypothetical protein